MSEPHYIIGIDLGTTNSVLAYLEVEALGEGPAPIHIFSIPQLVGPGSVGEQALLPSFILLPKAHEVSPEMLALPWDSERSLALGAFSRDRGAELPHRLISSAKSWLCNGAVDRNSEILPWGSAENDARLSPIQASAEILRHFRDAWNHTMAGDNGDLRLEKQEIFITIPASFDVVARDLTMQAAAMAGYPQVTLLEEPQAAFYAWIAASGEHWRDRVGVGDLILVVDVGGGTSDFSLIRVSEEGGGLALERIAVGEHLLVGGDNMDLTLTYAIAREMSSQGRKLDGHQMRGLTQSVRSAKERLFEDETASSCPVTILGKGSSLIGGTIRKELHRQEIDEVLMEGFFPTCGYDAEPETRRRSGMREMGLPYASDPGITRHLATFLKQTSAEAGGGDGAGFPTAVLYNGGVMKADILRGRISEIVTSWRPDQRDAPLREITTGDFDLSVARGAAYYGAARRGKGIRIHGGLSRSYYIGLEAALPAVPGMPAPIKALCVAPFGTEEGTELVIPDKEFGLVVGEPVVFDFLGSRGRRDDELGTAVEDWEGEIEEITTVEARLEGETGAVIPVSLHIHVTELGTLELWCVSREDDRRFKLEFNVREKRDS